MTSLERLPPPRERAEAGYYPDPLRTGRARWWDGRAWTLRMGPRVGAAAPMDKAVPPPERVCKRCGAEAETFASECPNCGRSYAQNTGLIVGLAAGAVALVLLMGGCGLLIAAVVNEVDDIEPSHAITQEEFDAVQLGEMRGAVQSRLGRPEEVKSFIGARGQATCIYYNESGEGPFQDPPFQFCFDARGLYSKREDG
jgi:hypothetical protein